MACRTRPARATGTRDGDAPSCRPLQCVGQSVSERDDRQGRIRLASGGKHRRTCDVQILDLMRAAIGIDDAGRWVRCPCASFPCGGRPATDARRTGTNRRVSRRAQCPAAPSSRAEKHERAVQLHVVFRSDSPIERRSRHPQRIDFIGQRHAAFRQRRLLRADRQLRGLVRHRFRA